MNKTGTNVHDCLRGNEKNDAHISLQNFQEEVCNAADLAFPKDQVSRYTDVHVILLLWEDEDPDMQVYSEISDLREVLLKDYNFSVDVYSIPSTRSHPLLQNRISKFLEFNRCIGTGANQKQNALKIVYYGGHGSLTLNRELICSNRSSDESPHYRQFPWTGIQRYLENDEPGVLMILDCCAAGSPSPGPGHGRNELIAACGFHEDTPGPGPFSFTQALIKELHDMSSIPCFTAAHLYARVLFRLHNHLPEDRNKEDMRAPIHVVLNSKSTSAFAPPIHISARLDPVYIDLGNSQGIPSIAFGGDAHEAVTLYAPSSHPSGPSSQYPYSPASSFSSLSPKYPMFVLSVKLKENFNTESLSGAVADWIKDMPVPAESIKFESFYDSFSTLLIILVPVPTWCYFKPHPAITCLGLVTSEPTNTPNQLNYLISKKLADSGQVRQGHTGKTRDNTESLPIQMNSASYGTLPGTEPIPPSINPWPSHVRQVYEECHRKGASTEKKEERYKHIKGPY